MGVAKEFAGRLITEPAVTGRNSWKDYLAFFVAGVFNTMDSVSYVKVDKKGLNLTS